VSTIAVTGSTDGIGLAAARALLARGHRVLVHARSEQRGRPSSTPSTATWRW
jgi:NAD(P)-dependent dehydrogenase (short-subunit alcohol dehydrogenase family)